VWTQEKVPIKSFIVCKNQPLTDIKINNYLGKDNYSATVSVTGTDNIFDMSVEFHCDNLTEVMLDAGVKAGGILSGPFIWATVDNRVKLILENSDTYNKINFYINSRNKKPIAKDDMVEGGVYVDKQNTHYVYICSVDTLKYEYKNFIRNHERHYKFSKKVITDGFLLAKANKNIPIDRMQFHLNNFDKGISFSPFLFKVQQSHSLISQVGKVDMRNGFFNELQDFYVKGVALQYRDAAKSEYNYRNYARFCCVSDLIHMNLAGVGPLQTNIKVYNLIDETIES